MKAFTLLIMMGLVTIIATGCSCNCSLSCDPCQQDCGSMRQCAEPCHPEPHLEDRCGCCPGDYEL